MGWTNRKASYNGAGKGGMVYKEFEDFLVDEMMQRLGLYILNGISPCPRVEMKFQSAVDDPTMVRMLKDDIDTLSVSLQHVIQ